MTTKHKIKLIWARFNWWLSFTKRSKKYADKMIEFSLVELTLRAKQAQFIKAHRENKDSDVVTILKIEIRLLGELLG